MTSPASSGDPTLQHIMLKHIFVALPAMVFVVDTDLCGQAFAHSRAVRRRLKLEWRRVGEWTKAYFALVSVSPLVFENRQLVIVA
jgi:hypothetical protein